MGPRPSRGLNFPSHLKLQHKTCAQHLVQLFQTSEKHRSGESQSPRLGLRPHVPCLVCFFRQLNSNVCVLFQISELLCTFDLHFCSAKCN